MLPSLLFFGRRTSLSGTSFTSVFTPGLPRITQCGKIARALPFASLIRSRDFQLRHHGDHSTAGPSFEAAESAYEQDFRDAASAAGDGGVWGCGEAGGG